MSLIQFIMSLFISAFIIIMGMLNIIAFWNLFKKAKKPGWFSLIPVYNIFILFEIVGMNSWWVFILFVASFFELSLFIFISIFHIVSFIIFPISLLYIIIMWYVIIYMDINLCRSFNKDSAFLVGLIFIPNIFFLILAFENNSYIGPNPIKDFIFPQKSSIFTTKYCLGCGKKVIDNSIKFCTNCGNYLLDEKNFHQK